VLKLAANASYGRGFTNQNVLDLVDSTGWKGCCGTPFVTMPSDAVPRWIEGVGSRASRGGTGRSLHAKYSAQTRTAALIASGELQISQLLGACRHSIVGPSVIGANPRSIWVVELDL